jgi:hypothetical protein
MRRYLILIFILSLLANEVLGQNNRVENFIKAGPADAEALTKAYLSPYPTGIGGALNTGWFNSASTQKPFGVNLQIRGALAIVPLSDREFNVDELNLEKTELVVGESSFSPTGAGKGQKGPWVRVMDEERQVARFNLPQGSDFSYVPAPVAQLSVGLIKNTDMTVRFIPEVKTGDYVDFNMKGIGLKHSVSQWIGGGKLLPIDISIFAGYNRLEMTAKFNMKPFEPDPTTNYDNQRVNIDFNTFAAKLLVGKDLLPYMSVYGAAGYETSSMDLAVTGNYPVTVRKPGGATATEPLTDPFSYRAEGKNDFSLTGGIKFQLLFFQIFGDYTLAKYPIVNAGIGFSFR